MKQERLFTFKSIIRLQWKVTLQAQENCQTFNIIWRIVQSLFKSGLDTCYILTSTLHWKSSQSQQIFSTIGTRYFKTCRETDHCKRDIKSFSLKLSKASKYSRVKNNKGLLPTSMPPTLRDCLFCSPPRMSLAHGGLGGWWVLVTSSSQLCTVGSLSSKEIRTHLAQILNFLSPLQSTVFTTQG